MPIEMPQPVAAYFAAERDQDADALGRCFADDGTVRDEGRTIHGPAAIRQWNIDARNKYHYTVEPLEVREEVGNIIVAGRVSRDFPGSPVDLQHIFQLRGGKIARWRSAELTRQLRPSRRREALREFSVVDGVRLHCASLTFRLVGPSVNHT